MNIFLEGPKGIGKTTLIKQALKISGKKATGFLSVRLVDQNGVSVGFCLERFTDNCETVRVVETVDLKTKGLFMSGNPENRVVNLDVFEEIREIVGSFLEYDVFVIDEIGGLELLSPVFVEYIKTVLDSNIVCIGTYKSKDNFKHMKTNVDVNLVGDPGGRFKEQLVEKYNAEFLTVTEQNKQEILKKIIYNLKKGWL